MYVLIRFLQRLSQLQGCSAQPCTEREEPFFVLVYTELAMLLSECPLIILTADHSLNVFSFGNFGTAFLEVYFSFVEHLGNL